MQKKKFKQDVKLIAPSTTWASVEGAKILTKSFFARWAMALVEELDWFVFADGDLETEDGPVEELILSGTVFSEFVFSFVHVVGMRMEAELGEIWFRHSGSWDPDVFCIPPFIHSFHFSQSVLVHDCILIPHCASTGSSASASTSTSTHFSASTSLNFVYTENDANAAHRSLVWFFGLKHDRVRVARAGGGRYEEGCQWCFCWVCFLFPCSFYLISSLFISSLLGCAFCSSFRASVFRSVFGSGFDFPTSELGSRAAVTDPDLVCPVAPKAGHTDMTQIRDEGEGEGWRAEHGRQRTEDGGVLKMFGAGGGCWYYCC